MLSPDTAGQYYMNLKDALSDDAPSKVKFIKVYNLLNELFFGILDGEDQLFSNFFSSSVYIFDRYKFPSGLIQNINKVRYFSNLLRRNTKLYCSSDDLIYATQALCRTIEHLSEQPVPEYLSEYFKADIVFHWKPESPGDEDQIIKEIRVTVKSRKKHDRRYGYDSAELICDSEDYGQVCVVLKDWHSSISKLLWRGAVLNLFDFAVANQGGNIDLDNSNNKDNNKADEAGEITLESTANSLVVLEPDYLIDVTDIAECFNSGGSNVYIYFLRRFLKTNTSYPLVVGNLVNSVFDEMINNKNIDFDTALKNAMSIKPMQIFALMEKDPDSIKLLRPGIAKHFKNLMQITSNFDCQHISIEPSFISPAYGLQGRLDAMLEYDDDAARKDVIELKSGRAPSIDMSFRGRNDYVVKTGVWRNHLAQVSCYNLLLDSAYSDRVGSSRILYSKTEEFPLRNVPNIIQNKQEVLDLRNWIIALERGLSRGVYSMFDTFTTKLFGKRPSFINSEIIDFSYCYSSLSDVEKKYFHAFVTFLVNESAAQRTGAGGARYDKGFSRLWRETIEEKVSKMTAIAGMRINHEKSDFNFFHIHFDLGEERNNSTSIRKGDLAILYPDVRDSSVKPYNRQQLKCTVKSIDAKSAVVSIRNKSSRKEFLDDYSEWSLEPDYIDSTNKKLFKSLYKFISSAKGKRDLLLGLKRPEFVQDAGLASNAGLAHDTGSACNAGLACNESKENEINNNEIIEKEINPEEKLNNGLLTSQAECVSRAVAARDYYLLQGPPGTGKTSYVLRAIVEQICRTTGENLLVMAYTNRAVDEICKALKTIDGAGFLRLGSKDSSEYPEHLISHLAGNMTLKQLHEKIKSTRIIVSTVASAVGTNEIFEIKKFDTAIIDEASQILEPQIIGILCEVKRFIMIGDQMQLPAIVTQSENSLVNIDEELHSINLFGLKSSLFERLAATCGQNGWQDATGMLKHQARMHRDLMKFPNEMFYNGELDILPGNQWQSSGEQRFDAESENPIESLLARRLVFINSNREDGAKLHIAEARLAADIVRTISNKYVADFNAQTVGVIAPYRLQCSEIRGQIGDPLAGLVTVDTVERFQGSERDIIIISFAVNYEHQLEQFFSSSGGGDLGERKFNVAITRAAKHLIVIGNRKILMKNKTFESFLSHVEQNGSMISIDDITRG